METNGPANPGQYKEARPEVVGQEGREATAHFDVEKVKEYLGDEAEVIKEVLKLTLTELDHSDTVIKKHFADKNLGGFAPKGTN